MAKEGKTKKGKEASIIQVIQEMVQAGEPEEKIVQSLKDLGVSAEKAKRLLLIGQADTFALLRGEIAKIVEDAFEAEKPKLTGFIEAEAVKTAEKSKEKVEKTIMEDLRKYEKDITGQSKTFQEAMNENVRKVTELSDRVRNKLNELGAAVSQVQQDLDEMKVRGVGLRSRLVAIILIAAGLGFCGYSLYLFTVLFGAKISIDAMIFTVMVALIGITMLFVATIL